MHKHFFQLKTWLVVFLMVITSLSLGLIIAVYEFNDGLKLAQAGADDNVTGYAWNSNIGWISFNCDNAPSTCGTVDYGVNINQETGNFSGYAWSSNIGWIDFAPVGPYPENPQIPANYSTTTRALTGWAKVVSLGDDGWLKFVSASVDAGGGFLGWMWNGNDNVAGIGWVSLNGANSGAGGGSYAVTAKSPSAFTSITIVRGPGSTDSYLTVSWSDVSGETSYEIWRDGVKIPPNLDANITLKTDGPLTTGQSYTYFVKACNTFGCVLSDSVTLATNSVAPVVASSITGTGECPDKINLSWPATTGADYYKLTRCQGESCSYASTTIPAIAPNTSYEDTTPDGTKKYSYKVEGCNNDPAECGDISDPSKEILPCPNLPTWRETISQ